MRIVCQASPQSFLNPSLAAAVLYQTSSGPLKSISSMFEEAVRWLGFLCCAGNRIVPREDPERLVDVHPTFPYVWATGIGIDDVVVLHELEHRRCTVVRSDLYSILSPRSLKSRDDIQGHTIDD